MAVAILAGCTGLAPVAPKQPTTPTASAKARREPITAPGLKPIPAAAEAPHGVAIGPDGHLYVADRLRNNVRRFEVDADGILNELPMPSDTAVLSANWVGLAGAPDGRILAIDRESERMMALGKDGKWTKLLQTLDSFTDSASMAVAPDGTDTIFAGTGAQGYTGDGGPAAAAGAAPGRWPPDRDRRHRRRLCGRRRPGLPGPLQSAGRPC